MGNYNKQPQDFIEAIWGVVDDLLRYHRRYVGQVMAVEQDSIDIHSDEFGTDILDKSTYITALPANSIGSIKTPIIGEFVVFGFEDGTVNTPRWFYRAPTYVTDYPAVGSNVVYQVGDASIIHNTNTKTLTIANGETSIVMNAEDISMIMTVGALSFGINANDQEIVFEVLASSIKISPTKVEILSPQILLNNKPWDTHTHPFTDTGVGAVGASVTLPPS